MTSGKYCEQSSESNAKTFLWGNSEDGAIRRKGQDGIAGSSRKYRRRDRKVKLNDSLEALDREETPDIASLPDIK